MENTNFDRWLRPAGAAFLVFFGLLLLALSFVMREGNEEDGLEKSSLTARLLYSSSFLENWFYDLRTARFYEHDNTSPNLVVVDITDESLSRIGRWPWTRTKHALLLDNLKAYGAKVVMFDVLFPEPESPAADGALAQSITRFSSDNVGNVYLGYGITRYEEEALPLPDVMHLSGVTGMPGKNFSSPFFIDKNNFAAPELTLFDAKYGFISAEPDLDGVFRHQKLVNVVDGTFFPSLSFGGFVTFYSNGEDRKVMVDPLAGSNDFELKILSRERETKVVLSPKGELKIRFFGGPRNFVRVPVEEVIEDPNPSGNEKLRRTFQDKAVLIGSSAFGAHDLRHTPVDPQTPGMYVHANLFHALDQNQFFRSEHESMLVSFLLFVLGVAGVFILFRFKSPLAETTGSLALAGGIYFADFFYFAPNGFFLRLFSCLFGVVSLHAWFTVLNVFHEAKEKKKIRDTFTRYVAPEIVKEMLSNPEKLKVGGEKREITMLFSDVRDFTTISERLTPQELATLLNVYMGRMTDILFETGGTLDKYIGDALVGFWGAPLDLPDHAYQAVRGAKLMLEALPEINKEFERRKFPRINVGIGLNTGEVSVGNMGSDRIFQYTALGDNMNLASRLESLTKYYGVNLMISEFTYERLGERRREFKLRPLDLVQVKGKSKAVKIFEVIPNWSPWAREDALLEKYTEAYERKYLQRRFDEAIQAFEEILRQIPDDKNTKKLLEEAQKLRENPPPENWDGVTIFTTK